jgi:hypothetical protein
MSRRAPRRQVILVLVTKKPAAADAAGFGADTSVRWCCLLARGMKRMPPPHSRRWCCPWRCQPLCVACSPHPADHLCWAKPNHGFFQCQQSFAKSSAVHRRHVRAGIAPRRAGMSAAFLCGVRGRHGRIVCAQALARAAASERQHRWRQAASVDEGALRAHCAASAGMCDGAVGSGFRVAPPRLRGKCAGAARAALPAASAGGLQTLLCRVFDQDARAARRWRYQRSC